MRWRERKAGEARTGLQIGLHSKRKLRSSGLRQTTQSLQLPMGTCLELEYLASAFHKVQLGEVLVQQCSSQANRGTIFGSLRCLGPNSRCAQCEDCNRHSLRQDSFGSLHVQLVLEVFWFAKPTELPLWHSSEPGCAQHARARGVFASKVCRKQSPTRHAHLRAIWAACHQRERVTSLPVFESYICARRQAPIT